LCAFAVIRVFIFSAAFPFFNNVDEPAHFDMVYKYSQFQSPSKLSENLYGRVPAEVLLLYGTNEYFSSPDAFPDGYPPPLYKEANAENDPGFQRNLAGSHGKN